MKKYLWIIPLSILVSACSIEEPSSPVENNLYPYEVSAWIDDNYADSESRAYVDSDLKVLWENDDRISLFNKYTYNKEYRFSGRTGANSGVFKEVNTGEIVVGNELDNVYAVYPYMELTEISNSGIITLDLPAEQTYKDNSFGRGDNTMISATTNTNLLFKNLCGYLVLKFYGEGVSVSSISLKGNNGEPIAGTADVTANVGSTPTLSFWSSGTYDTITLNCETPVELGATAADATVFWLVVPPTKFTGGFTVTVTDSNGNTFVKESTTSKEIIRNSTYRIKAIEVIPAGNIMVESVSLNKTSLSMMVGDSETLVATVVPSNATNQTVSWSSSDPSVVTVDENGTLNAIAEGEAIITAQAGSKTATCEVTVLNVQQNNIIYYTSTDGSVVVPNRTDVFGANYVSSTNENGQGIMTFDGDVTAIGYSAFNGCQKLNSIIIPDSVTEIKSQAFSGTRITSLTIPSSVTQLDPLSFVDSYVIHIDVDQNNTVYDSRDNCNAVIKTATNSLVVGTFGTTIPETVTTIGETAFINNQWVTTITIPASVTSIGNNAFQGCAGLSTVTVLRTIPPSVSQYSFSGCNCLFMVPVESYSDYKTASDWGIYSEKIRPIIPDEPTSYYGGWYLCAQAGDSISFSYYIGDDDDGNNDFSVYVGGQLVYEDPYHYSSCYGDYTYTFEEAFTGWFYMSWGWHSSFWNITTSASVLGRGEKYPDSPDLSFGDKTGWSNSPSYIFEYVDQVLTVHY